MNTDEYLEKYDAFIKDKGFARQTQESYEQHSKSFFAFVDRYYPRLESPAAANKRIVSDYHDYLCEPKTADEKPLANKSICAMLFAVKSFCSFLADQDLIATDPAKGLILPKQERRLIRDVLTETEVIKVLKSHNTNTPFGLRDRATLELVFSTDIRTSELCNLKIAYVDLKEQTVFIDRGKGNASRMVPTGQYAIMYIEKYLQNGRRFFVKMKVQNPGYLFLSQFCNPFDRKNINK